MDARTRELVRQRAGQRCEYCHFRETAVPHLVFHVDHIIAKQHVDDLSDDPNGLAWACSECNYHKGPSLQNFVAWPWRILLCTLATTLVALAPVGQAGDKPAAWEQAEAALQQTLSSKKQRHLVQAAEGLFDWSQPDSLGLATAKGEHQLLYRATKDGYRFCHHANLGTFDGQIYAMWSSGLVHEDHNGQRVLYCRSTNGVDWSKPVVLAEDPDGEVGPKKCNAAGFYAAGNTLVAYYGVSGRLHAKTSSNGLQWDQAREIVRGSFMNAPRQLRCGRLLMGGQSTMTDPLLMTSDQPDGLTEWRQAALDKSSDLKYPEPTWFDRANGTIVMLFRSRGNNPWLFASLSTDNGRSWSRPARTGFPDATSRASAGNLPDGTAFIVNNPSRQPNSIYPSTGRRNPLTIALSRDGVTFDRAYVVRGAKTTMRFPGKNKLPGWQYPHAMVWNEHLYVAYSVNKEDVGISRIALRDLTP